MTEINPEINPEINTGNNQSDDGLAAMPDPRPGFGQALDLAGTVVRQMQSCDLRRQSPCEDYDAGERAAHLVAVVRRITAVAKGLDPFSVPQTIDGLEPDGFVPAWEEAVREQQAVWADDSVLGRTLVLPFATLPGAIALAIYISEVLVHAWDLAEAIGFEVNWNDELVEGALATMQFGLPSEPRGGDVPFGPVVEVAATAPSIDRLVAWLGRQP